MGESWPVFLFHILLAILQRLPLMSSLLRKFSKRLDRANESSAPLDTDGAPPPNGVYEKKFEDFQYLRAHPLSHSEIVSCTSAALDAVKGLASGAGIDDRKLLLENAVRLMSKAKDFEASKAVQQLFITILYKDLPHPPSGYVSLPKSITVAPPPPVNYAFRSADGSNYNPLAPTIGMAGSPYARSVASTNNSPKTALPDPGLVFDTLLKRDKFEQHPGGISSLFFAFADLVIHSIFNTDRRNPRINNTSSYLDLSVLYGNSEAEVETVRYKDAEGKRDGSGRLYQDVFADQRLLIMPPASCALLVLLSRNHNFIAQRILDINENQTYKKTFEATEEGDRQRNAQDDEIFNRTRLVNCGYFMNIILGDYVGAILGLVRDQSDWRLDPLQPIREASHNFTPVGEGNVVSVEFNLLYRWHSTLSAQDTEWFENDVFKRAFPGVNPAELTTQQFKEVAHGVVKQAGSDPRKWAPSGLKRDASGRFKDGDLANVLQNATDWYAGAFKARGIPETLRVVELMAIEQSRTWGTCSDVFKVLNSNIAYSTFKEWNPDPKVHTAAAALYKDIDNLELHVGLQAEEAKKPGPGAGLCPGYTISRAILADAVCLTRGDRFMTVDLTPHNLTAWGYQDCQFDTQDGSFGGMLTKLLFRTLPDYYPKGSAYAHFPFLQPQYMQKEMIKTDPALAAKYTWDRPVPRLEAAPVYTFADVKAVLDDEKAYVPSYDRQAFEVVRPSYIKKPSVTGQFAAGKATLAKAIFDRPATETAHLFEAKTLELLKTKAFEKIGTQDRFVDVVKDVINLLPIHWLSQEVAGFPLKTEKTPKGQWYESITYDKWSDIAEYIYLDFDPVNDWRLRESSQANARECISVIDAHLDQWAGKSKYPFLRKLWEDHGKSTSVPAEFAAYLVAATVPTATLYSQVLSHVVDFYLADERKAQREEIVALSKSTDKDANAKIMRHAYEALSEFTAGVYRTATKAGSVGPVEVQGGQSIFASIIDANTDATVFQPNAHTPNFDATAKSGIVGFDDGFLTPSFFDATVPAVLGVIFGLKDLKRGPNESGKLLTFTEDFHGAKRVMYPSQRGLVTPWPESLVLEYTD
ncbi:heme peroxidase [Pholiota conissans]|uniref:Heme peroxidase n=1 Tax=Pholiota conissans TaxID=109636 RepID=A0A9P6CSH6_9AGAR|nr:heme peroxidase [Pholiota conissans]